MRYGVLGPLEVIDGDGTPVELGGRQPRTLLALLLAAGGRSVPVEAIADAIWGERQPASATGTLHSYVSRLRKQLGDGVLLWDDAGYRLDVEAADVDFRRFEQLANEGRELLGLGKLVEAVDRLDEADALWRGPAFVEFGDHEFVTGIATRLSERRMVAAEDRINAMLELGQHTAVVATLTELVAAHPLRESLRSSLALALYRSGRQADALRALADAGRTLREELGIEPSRPLRDLEAAILAQDPALDLAAEPIRRPRDATAPDASPSPVVAAEPVPHARSSHAAGETPAGLAGRDAERAQLAAALTECERAARFVVVEGEPGIGKTRLLDELREIGSSAGAMVVWGRSDEGGAAPALWPWLAPLRALAHETGEIAPALTGLVAGEVLLAPGRALDVQFERFEAVADMIERLAAVRPVVILLDDLQWFDPASAELLAYLAGRIERGVLIAATMRELDVGRNDEVTGALAAMARRAGTRRVQLRGLSADALGSVLEGVAARPIATDLVAGIHERSEGNPFYAIELARLLDEDHDLRGIPAGVRDVIRRRVAQLPEPTVEVLGIAAVIGRDVSIELLTRASRLDLDACLDALEPAIVHRLLLPVADQPSLLRFSHALVREVLVDDLSALRRARLHLRVADAMESTGAEIDDIEILAEHLWRASAVGAGARAADALERAADVAVRRVAYAAAEDLLTRAVQLRRTSGTSTEHLQAELSTITRLLDVARARRYFQGVQNPELFDRARHLAETCGRRDLLVEILWFQWAALATAVRLDEAGPLAQTLREMTEDDPDPVDRFTGFLVMGTWKWGVGAISEAADILDEGRRVITGVPIRSEGFDIERRIVGECFWIFNTAARGDLSSAEVFAHFDAMLEGVKDDRFARASGCGFAITTALALGDWEANERYCAIAYEADPSSQFAFWGGQLLMHRGNAIAWNGDIDEGVATFEQGYERYVGVGGRSGLATFLASMALGASRHGRNDVAARFAAAARAELDAYREGWNATVVAIAEAGVAHGQGDFDRARERLEHAVDVATRQGAMAFVRRARDAAASLGLELGC